jgi:hypothetical protein
LNIKTRECDGKEIKSERRAGKNYKTEGMEMNIRATEADGIENET